MVARNFILLPAECVQRQLFPQDPYKGNPFIKQAKKIPQWLTASNSLTITLSFFPLSGKEDVFMCHFCNSVFLFDVNHAFDNGCTSHFTCPPRHVQDSRPASPLLCRLRGYQELSTAAVKHCFLGTYSLCMAKYACLRWQAAQKLIHQVNLQTQPRS